MPGTEDLKKVRHGPRPHELMSQQGRWTREEGTLSPPCKQDSEKLGVHPLAQVKMEAPNCLPGCPLAKGHRRVKGSLLLALVPLGRRQCCAVSTDLGSNSAPPTGCIASGEGLYPCKEGLHCLTPKTRTMLALSPDD